MQKRNENQLVSSRSVGMRDISALSAPISRISSCPQGRDDEGRSGFTLIELLVVILIIGVLAAIAVPQYQKAMLKSRFSSLMPTTQATRDSNEIHYLNQGHYASQLSDLEITTPNNAKMNLSLSKGLKYAYVIATRNDIKNNLIMYQQHSENFPGETHCESLEGNEQARWLCEDSLKGTRIQGSITSGYNTYILKGAGNGLLFTKLDELKTLALQIGEKYEQFYATRGYYPSSLSQIGMECPQEVQCLYNGWGHIRVVFQYPMYQGFVQIGYYGKHYASSSPWNLAQGKAVCIANNQMTRTEGDSSCGALGGTHIGAPPGWGNVYELKE